MFVIFFFFCLNLSWFGLTKDHEHFLQEPCDAHFCFSSLNLHLSERKTRSGGVLLLLRPHHHHQLLQTLSESSHRMVEPLGLISPRNEYAVDGNASQDHEQSVAGFNRAGDHWNYRDEHGSDQVEDREDQIHLDRAVQVRLGPSKPWQTQDGYADT